MTLDEPSPVDLPSCQLENDIRDAAKRSLARRRPILHHLNADTSWLLQIPRPALPTAGRAYFNILIDPWFKGPQADVASWFSQQSHAIASAVGSIAEVEELILRVEKLLASDSLSDINEELGASVIDAIVISHEFTDHCHMETLLEAHSDVTIFASPEAARLIRSWNHFRTIREMPVFAGRGSDWRKISMPPLPRWVGISRLQSDGDFVYYHSAVLVSFLPFRSSSAVSNNTKDGTDTGDPAECVIYTPHGIHPDAVSPVAAAFPPLRPLAFCHGLHDVRLSKAQQLNLGGHNGLAVQRILKAKYWVATHDEIKKGGGIVAWFLRRKIISLKEALDEEAERLKADPKNAELSVILEDNNFRVVANGESIVLE